MNHETAPALLRASWKTVLLAGLIGAASGAASVALVALILHSFATRTGRRGSVALFAALCWSSWSRGSVPSGCSAA